MQDKYFEVQFLYDRGDLLRLLENFDDEFFMEVSELEYKRDYFIEISFSWSDTSQGGDYWFDVFYICGKKLKEFRKL